jgi:hypothetical protein
MGDMWLGYQAAEGDANVERFFNTLWRAFVPFEHVAEIHQRPPKCFARGEWKVFLDSDADFRRAIRYVELNPVREGKAVQRWEFVTDYV